MRKLLPFALLALGMGWFVLNHPHLALGFPCECWRFTYTLGLICALLALTNY